MYRYLLRGGRRRSLNLSKHPLILFRYINSITKFRECHGMVYYNYRWQLIKFELPFLDLAIAQSCASHSGIAFHHIINYKETNPLLRSWKKRDLTWLLVAPHGIVLSIGQETNSHLLALVTATKALLRSSSNCFWLFAR